MEFCMSDNIRNKKIFETKIAKIAKKYQNLTFWKNDSNVHNGNVFANTTKNSGDSRMYSYWDLAWTKHKFKKWFFGKNFQNFRQNWILIFFCCTTSMSMLFLKFFANFLHERFLEIWLGQESVTEKRTDARTDGRTYTEGKTIYVSRRGRHITRVSVNGVQSEWGASVNGDLSVVAYIMMILISSLHVQYL